MVHLLAYDGNADNQRQGFLGKLLHDTIKHQIRKQVDKIHADMMPVLEYKRANGWANPAIGKLDEHWRWVISLYELPINAGIGGFKGPDDINRKMLNNGADIAFKLLDEDLHYALPVLLWLKRVHETWNEDIEIACNQAEAILNFQKYAVNMDAMYNEAVELTKPLEQLSDSDDEKEINYIETEKRLLNGMDNKSKRKG